MNKIKNIEKVYQISTDWKPTDLVIIKKLEWLENDLNIHFFCRIRKGLKERPEFLKEVFEVSVIFKKVSALKLDIRGTRFFQIIGFDIIDISNNGWEGINFEIEDYENGCIGFYCNEIIIDEVGMPEMLDF